MNHKLMICIGALLLAASVAGAADPDPKDELGKQDLQLQGALFVLKGENDLAKDIAVMTQAQRECASAERTYRSAEQKVARAKAYIAQLQYKLDKMKGDTKKAMTADDYNRLIDQINKMTREITQLNKEKQEHEQAAQKEVDEAKIKFAQTVVEAGSKADALKQQYEKLSQDKDVQALIDQATKADGHPYKLGPSPAFVGRCRLLEQMQKSIEAGEIPVRREGNVMLVDVKLNDKPTQTMVLDTGAAAICLPYDMATETLGLEVTDTDPIIRMQQADGKLIEGRLKQLDSVQVGRFLIKDVQCVVLPKESIAAQPLLGGTFLNHFTYRIDPQRQMLLLTKSEKAVEELRGETPPQPRNQ